MRCDNQPWPVSDTHTKASRTVHRRRTASCDRESAERSAEHARRDMAGVRHARESVSKHPHRGAWRLTAASQLWKEPVTADSQEYLAPFLP
jgi:hypothetical protein